MIEEIMKIYNREKEKISVRLEEFKKVFEESDERIFAELAFCLCTPQSKALKCWESVERLVESNVLYFGKKEEIESFLKDVRFKERKAEFIVKAREKFFKNGKWILKSLLSKFKNCYEAREWLVKNVKGLGMKEASHFLRNIGLGFDLAILDVHILKNLVNFGIIKEIPKNLNKKQYLLIEKRMKEFSSKINLSLQELDLTLWAKETGFVFK